MIAALYNVYIYCSSIFSGSNICILDSHCALCQTFFIAINQNSFWYGASKLAHIVGPQMTHHRYAIEMAYRWRAVGGPLLCANWDYTILLKASNMFTLLHY